MARHSSKSRRGKSSPAKGVSSRGSSSRGHVRIIGGSLKRSHLEVIDSPGLRPTPDRVRETLFNWIGFDVHGARVLDLFAGSGALSMEAISRGADTALVMEMNREAAQLLTQNSERLKVADKISIYQGDAFLKLDLSPEQTFDIVFIDPPFHQGMIDTTTRLLEEREWLSPNALIYVECESDQPAAVPAQWTLLKETKAGESLARLYQRTAP